MRWILCRKCALRCACVLLAGLSFAALGLAQTGAAQVPSHPEVHPALWPQGHWPLPPDAELEQRVRALMAKMSLRDKVGQVIQADIGSVTPEDVRKYRLGSILAGGNSKPGGGRVAGPAKWLALSDAFHRAAMDTRDGGVAIPLLFGADAVHGNNDVSGSTVFPHNIALGATRDPALIQAIGRATAEEARAAGINWAFAPTLTVPQDDRWGRTYEGYSENPALVAQYAAAAVEGLQGKPGTPQFLDGAHVIASAKHFVGDGFTRNGLDQGDAEVSEEQLRDIAAAGYLPAIDAGVQSVMVSYSSWNGVKMSGNKGLLTDVLKQRMDFRGFAVGDWNSHGQIPGCSNEDCPQAIVAGLDMYMAPDSWRGLYRHTLAEVKSGVIPMVRLDDAVSRILRVKLRLGLFDAVRPSRQPLGGHFDVIGSPAHRALARRAVRESLVLLKNQDHLLPLDPRRHILVAGAGADSIPQQSGGWTLTWQGTGTTNADFPHATSIGHGIRAQVEAAGGTVELSADGHYTHKPDVAIVVYGEHPYAEFQGDVPTLAFAPGDPADLELIRRLRAQGIAVVSVFLSGRPLWVNPEINASNAFVAAWLPGTEGEGVADVLLRDAAGKVQHDFHGKLSYSWPRSAMQTPLNVGQEDYHPQFAYGYGLTYEEDGDLGPLSEVSGLPANVAAPGVYLQRGEPAAGLAAALAGVDGSIAIKAAPSATRDGSLRISALDYQRQEDARRLAWSGQGEAAFVLRADTPLDLTRQTNGDVQLIVELRIEALAPGKLTLGMACGGTNCTGLVPVDAALKALPKGQWLQVGMPLKCFEAAGADMRHIEVPFRLETAAAYTIDISRVALGTDPDHVLPCTGP
ncbi:glycoside hydrolase family 3 protein [Rhodanobacter lindaniclasticus]|uniref:1,4-beta-D-glucan glucohydrolase n=1 Tax=Rhodanobacter lindaniclasticus TaxID=75310 RepID=A0A4S3KH82_9GAMM|nr:exo 1,3/1,4-beta-D-glucan glucohydrolase [Rhodanobacter lindaniclasticus]THD07939.1 1,4-beta-D-glucan glucohydrolase [Rhodanobacter lindaniclasticus]